MIGEFPENDVNDTRLLVVDLVTLSSTPATSVTVLPPHESLVSLVTSTKSVTDVLLKQPGDEREAITVVSDGSVESEDPEIVLVSGLARGARKEGDSFGSCVLPSVASVLLS